MYSFVSSNKKKWEEVCKILNYKINWVKVSIPEIQGLDLKKIIKEKIKYAYNLKKIPLVVEDVSLILEGFGNFPGPLIKWFLKGAGREGIIKCCYGLKNFNAIALCGIGVYDGKKFNYFEGKIEGKISKKPKGDNGFGWDPLFIPKGYKKTFAEMEAEEKNKISHRKIAWEKFKNFLL